MSHPAYFSPRVEITEFTCILKVVKSAVFVDTFPGYSVWFPPTLRRNHIGYYFCGCTLTTMCDYVYVIPTGILLRLTKLMVFVPFWTLPVNLSTSCPNYFGSPFLQRSLVFSFRCIKSFCFSIAPVYGSTTMFTGYQANG